MAEARIDVPEIYKQPYTPEESLYRLAPGVRNSRVIEALTLFQKERMHGPEADRQLFSLFAAIPNPEDPSGLIRAEEGVEPKTIWDQVKWASTHESALTPAQRESLIPLRYFGIQELMQDQLTIQYKREKRALSPAAKKAAEKAFQAYDRHVADVFDPKLPDWHVAGKATLGLVAIATALAACGPAVPPKPKEQSPTAPVFTQTYTPTETNTPTVTLTPTITNTPSETPVPRSEYRKTLGEHLNDATLKKKEDFAGIAQDILNYPEIPGPVTLDFDPIVSYETAGDSGVYLICKMGTNCKVRAFVRVADPVNGPDRWYVFWEVRNPGDDHSKVLITYIGSDDVGANLIYDAQEKLDMLNEYAVDGAKIVLAIPTKLKGNIHYHNPVLKEMYPDMSAADDILKMHTIPDGLSRIPQFLADIFTIG